MIARGVVTSTVQTEFLSSVEDFLRVCNNSLIVALIVKFGYK